MDLFEEAKLAKKELKKLKKERKRILALEAKARVRAEKEFIKEVKALDILRKAGRRPDITSKCCTECNGKIEEKSIKVDGLRYYKIIYTRRKCSTCGISSGWVEMMHTDMYWL